jgi:PAS domain S-box-containing protein
MALIVHVEQDKTFRYERSRLLMETGHRVLEADTIEAAALMVSALNPHLMVLGASRCDPQSLQRCQTMKSAPATVPLMVLCLCGSAPQPGSATSGCTGADGYLIEPVQPIELLTTVRTLIRLAELERAHGSLMERLPQTERQLADVTEAAGCGLWNWDIPTGRLQWYGMHEQLAGMLPGGFSAKVQGFMEILHPEDRERVWCTLQDLIARREARFSEEYRFVHADGRVRWMLGTGRFVYDEAGTALRMTGVVQDITERKEAEAKLLLYRSIVQSSTDAIAVIDREGRYVEQNEAHQALLGYSDQDLFGHRPDLHTVGESYDRVMDGLSATGRFKGDIVSRRKDGSSLEIEMHAFPVLDDTGAPRYFVGIKRDITARKQQLQALHESEEQFRTLADHMSQLAWMADPDGCMFWYNRRWCDYTGRASETMRDGWETLLHPDCAVSVLAGLRRSFQSGEPWEATVSFRHADGRYRWFLSRAVPVHDSHGRITRWFGTHTDVTDLQEAEERLRQRETQLRIITDAVPSLISYVDRDERYQFVNCGYESLFGLSRHEIVGKSVEELLGATYADVLPYVRRALVGETVRFESQLMYVGKPHWVLAIYTPDIKPDGRVAGFFALVTDISERKQQEDELRRWKDELERRVEERTQELLASQARLRDLASQVTITEQRERRKVARDLHDYLAQFLVVGRMKAGRLTTTLRLAPADAALVHDLDDVLRQALDYTRTLMSELCAPALQEAGLPSALRWLSERMQKLGLCVELRSDCERLPLPDDHAILLFQSVRELLFNVLKHAGVDHATVSLTVSPQGHLYLIVEDRGKGLDADALIRSAKPGHLGLFSVRERMESMGGWLLLERRSGGGTRAELGLPGVRLPSTGGAP